MAYSAKRQAFLVDQGYAFKTITHLNGIESMPGLLYRDQRSRLELLHEVLLQSEDAGDIEKVKDNNWSHLSGGGASRSSKKKGGVRRTAGSLADAAGGGIMAGMYQERERGKKKEEASKFFAAEQRRRQNVEKKKKAEAAEREKNASR